MSTSILERVLTQAVPAVLTLMGAILGAIGAYFVQERRIRTDPRAEFMAEQAVNRLLESEKWEKRSFEAIKDRLPGFGDDELRKILVRAGAVCFEGKDGEELWGLIDRPGNEP